MALPTSRNTNYEPDVTPVKAADLNDIQDCIVGAKHGPIDTPFLPHAANGWTSGVGAVGAVPHIACATPGSLAAAIVPVPVGDRVTAIKCQVSGDGIADAVIKAFVLTSAMARTEIGTVTITNPTSTWTQFSIGSFVSTQVPSGGCVFLQIDGGAVAGIKVSTCLATHDKL